MSTRRLYNPDDGTMEYVDTTTLSDATGLKCEDPSLAIQSQKEEADINTIVKRFGLTGVLPSVVRVPSYEDFSNAPSDYRGALEMVRTADDAFRSLPAALRARFNDSAAEFVDFCMDPQNMPELKKLGLTVDIGVEPATITPKPEDGPKA